MKKTHKKHMYDVDVKDIFQRYCSGILQAEIKSPHSTEYHVKHFKSIIDNFCNDAKINFDEETFIVLTTQNGDAYLMFLACLLLFYEEHKISLLLNYHLQKCVRKKTDFLNKMEFQVLDQVERMSIFDNSIRLREIGDWINSKRAKIANATDNNGARLKWMSKPSYLKAISQSLYAKEYTNTPSAFETVFTQGKAIYWLKDYGFLVYLLFLLQEKQPPFITVENGKSNAYQKVARTFFLEPSEFLPTLVNKNRFASLLHEITGRNAPNHTQLKENVVQMLNTIEKNK